MSKANDFVTKKKTIEEKAIIIEYMAYSQRIYQLEQKISEKVLRLEEQQELRALEKERKKLEIKYMELTNKKIPFPGQSDIVSSFVNKLLEILQNTNFKKVAYVSGYLATITIYFSRLIKQKKSGEKMTKKQFAGNMAIYTAIYYLSRKISNEDRKY